MDYKELTTKDFHFIKTIESRWRDMDAIRHINNATYLNYFETTRVEYLSTLGFDLIRWESDSSVILASMKIDYLKQSTYPSIYEIGCRITRLGKKSFDILSVIFDSESGLPIVAGIFTLVTFDYKTQQTIPINDAIKNSYSPLDNHN
jgi:acyl-CoA thioester hydrolase